MLLLDGSQKKVTCSVCLPGKVLLCEIHGDDNEMMIVSYMLLLCPTVSVFSLLHHILTQS